MDATVLGTLGHSPVALVNVTIPAGDGTLTLTAIQAPNGNLVIPRPFWPPTPIAPAHPIIPGLFVALFPPTPI